MDSHPDSFGPGLWFSAKCLNTRTVRRAKAPGEVIGVALAHNLRSHNDGHRHRSKIDSERTPLNEILRGPRCPLVGAELAASILDELGLRPGRIDAIMAVELVCQPPPGADMCDFWAECLAWADGRYQHVISAVVHRDQARPHLHVVALAVHDGQLAGNTLSSGANRFTAQRRDFMAHIAKTLGLRPNRRKGKTLAQLAASAGRGPKRAAEAAKRDAEYERKVSRLRMGVSAHGGQDSVGAVCELADLRMGVGANGGSATQGLDPHAPDPLNCAAPQSVPMVASAQALADLTAVIGAWAALDRPSAGGMRGTAQRVGRKRTLLAVLIARRVAGRLLCSPAFIGKRAYLAIQARGP